MNKKQIPYELLASVEVLVKNCAQVVGSKVEDNCYYSLFDKDESSNFYFKVYIDSQKARVEPHNDKSLVLCEYFPYNTNSLHPNKIHCKKDDVQRHLGIWVNLLNQYNQIESVYDDPFIKKYKEYFSQEFVILDKDADTAPFDPHQQDDIEKYLTHVEKKLLSYKVSKQDQAIVDEIVQEISEAKENIQRLTKREVVDRVAKIWAKVYKWSRKHAKEIFTKAKNEAIKQALNNGIKFLLNEASDAVSKLHMPH